MVDFNPHYWDIATSQRWGYLIVTKKTNLTHDINREYMIYTKHKYTLVTDIFRPFISYA